MSDLMDEDFLDSCFKLIINAFICNQDAIEIRMVCFKHHLEAENYFKSSFLICFMPVSTLRMLWAVLDVIMSNSRCLRTKSRRPSSQSWLYIRLDLWLEKDLICRYETLLLWLMYLKIHWYRRRTFKDQYVCSCLFFHGPFFLLCSSKCLKPMLGSKNDYLVHDVMVAWAELLTFCECPFPESHAQFLSKSKELSACNIIVFIIHAFFRGIVEY